MRPVILQLDDAFERQVGMLEEYPDAGFAFGAFGMASVSRDGFESPVEYPGPQGAFWPPVETEAPAKP